MSLLRTCSVLSCVLTAAACDPPAGPPAAISVSVDRSPLLIAFRDGPGAAWHTPAPTGTGAFAFDVHGPYMVTVVCDDEGLVTTRQIARTPDDDREIDVDCTRWTDEPHSVTGRMMQSGSVHLGSWVSFSDQPVWDFFLSAGAGPRDLIAISEDRIAIERGMMFDADTVLPDIDVSQQGALLEPLAFSVADGAPGEVVDAIVELSTATTISGYVYAGPPAGAKQAPASVLVASDRQMLWASGWQAEGEAQRYVGRPHAPGASTAFELPALIAGAQLSSAGTPGAPLSASWEALPDHDRVILLAWGGVATPAGDESREHELSLSAAYLEAAGEDAAVLETELPGFVAAWRIDPAREHGLVLSTRARRGDDVLGTIQSRSFNAAISAAPRRLRGGGDGPARGGRVSSFGRHALTP